MSTNPFRQTRNQQGPPGDSTYSPSDSRRAVSDGSGSKTADLSLDTNVPSTLHRHVSFASPPVDTTIPAASYPSSPESLRSPRPSQFGQPATPNYRIAFLSDPFEDLGQDVGQDNTIQEALSNAQSNASMVQTPATRREETAVRDTLDRFAAAPRPVPLSSEPAAPHPAQIPRQSLDVDAFKRLLLTGDSGRSTPGTATPPIAKHNNRVLNDSSSGTDTTSLSQASIYDVPGLPNRDEDYASRSSHGQDRDADDKPKVPPPAPAPRRGKSVKVTPSQPAFSTEPIIPNRNADAHTSSRERTARKPPTPPLARRRSYRTPSVKSEEGAILPLEASSPTESLRMNQKAPPPPPIRRQHSISQRRASNDLTPTIEEADTAPAPSTSSRRSSNDRPMPLPSKNSSQSVKRQSLGLMNPPPVPPARRGRGSSRSSMDSFRPSSKSIMGEESGEDHMHATEASQRSTVKYQTHLNSSSADSILAELANLQTEVDAARRAA